jgi:acyl-CoA thioester hydrolase
VIVKVRVEWPDTDAATHYQYSVVMRWIQVAEATLHQRLGIAERTFGSTPRVHLEVDFKRRLWFLDEVDVDFFVDRVGRTSLRYGFKVRKGDVVAAQGAMVCAYMPSGCESPVPWPEDMRELFGESGDVTDRL